MLAYLGRDPGSPTDRVEGTRFTTTLRAGDDVLVVQVDLAPSGASCAVLTPPRGDRATAMRITHERILAMLGLAAHPTRFETQMLASPELAGLVTNQRGLRVPLVPDPFCGLIWAIVGQQISLPFAYTLRRRLIERTSEPVPGFDLHAPPAPRAVAALEVSDLTALSFSRSKAEYLIDASRAILDGQLPLDELHDASATRLERTLRAVRGIGPWSANYLMMRSYGFLDCVPLGDTGLTSGLKEFFALDTRPDKVETLALMARFSPYRSLATFHLWQRHGTAA
jgi:AraC family transcriptional regulator of adaptative response / DNA-3-methyladenine glycosylase II